MRTKSQSRESLDQYWRELRLALERMSLASLDAITEALLACRQREGTIFIAGNGGSAATASHFACDLAKGTQCTGAAPFRVIPLSDNMPLVTAWANDVSYDQVFAQQLAPLVRYGDALVVISASGSSPNVLAAAHVALSQGAEVIALTGPTGGKLRRLATLLAPVPCERIEQVEDVHMMIAHSVCVALRARLQAESAGQKPLPAVSAALSGLIALDREGDASLAI